MNVLALSDAKVGSAGVVERVDLPDEVSHYLAHLGFLPAPALKFCAEHPPATRECIALMALKLVFATRQQSTSFFA